MRDRWLEQGIDVTNTIKFQFADDQVKDKLFGLLECLL
jgi:hypothetical protein